MLELLKQNKKIIVNTDIDGIFSALVLHNFVGCEVVGFCNSDNTVWIDKRKVSSIYDCVYIDMFVPLSNVGCIDQHIISVNERHHELIRQNNKKYNPNLDNPRFHNPSSSYFLKYPFGTVHYIIAGLESTGIKIDLDLFNTADNLQLIDFILRADDAMKTTVDSPYSANAKQWWTWLLKYSKNGTLTGKFITYLSTLNSSKVTLIKKATTEKVMGAPFFCTSKDGGFKSILEESSLMKNNVKDYFKYLADISKLKCFDLELNLSPHIGTPAKISLSQELQNELIDFGTINNKKVFSYAFIWASTKPDNFSYTVM